jgi:hypothetical protein
MQIWNRFGKLKKHKASGAIKPKGLNRIAKIG